MTISFIPHTLQISPFDQTPDQTHGSAANEIASERKLYADCGERDQQVCMTQDFRGGTHDLAPCVLSVTRRVMNAWTPTTPDARSPILTC
jgi:hypothetical protein